MEMRRSHVRAPCPRIGITNRDDRYGFSRLLRSLLYVNRARPTSDRTLLPCHVHASLLHVHLEFVQKSRIAPAATKNYYRIRTMQVNESDAKAFERERPRKQVSYILQFDTTYTVFPARIELSELALSIDRRLSK